MRKTSLSAENIKKLDKSNMLGLLMDFPQQCRYACDIAKKTKILFQRRDFSRIVFCGLGGSAIGADLARSYLYYESKTPVIVLREYDLPEYVDEGTLVFISSYSGNTEETLSSYAQAKAKKAVMIAVSSGGKLKENALKDNVTFIEIPKGLPPRSSLGYLSIIPLYIMEQLGLAAGVTAQVSEAARVLEELRNECLNPKVGTKDNIAKAIALKLYNKIAVIYSASIHFDVCAVRFRGQIAENSKGLSWHHTFPEMNHNEIVGWENPKKLFKGLVVVMLRDKTVHPRTALRMDITASLIRKEGAKVIEISSRGESLLARMFSLIYIGDFVSFYLAILYGIDPTPVEKVTFLKNELAKVK
jgi:glucose/mannose-6-phosphate isomerase